jgi:type II pantothenate kinase
MKLLTKFETPEEALVASTQGDNTPVDMSVGDIYGTDYNLIGLNRDLIASSCAKLRFAPDPAPNDLAKSVFGMFILNLTQLSYLISMIEDVDKVMIVGNMISVPLLMESAQACMNYYSKGTRQMIFNEYSFYLGAIGELI